MGESHRRLTHELCKPLLIHGWQYNTYRLPLEITHPIENIWQITNTPLEFQNLLWRSKVLVTHFGIYEEYQWIRRQYRPNYPERAILQPAYKVFYSWTSSSWSVSRLPRN